MQQGRERNLASLSEDQYRYGKLILSVHRAMHHNSSLDEYNLREAREMVQKIFGKHVVEDWEQYLD